MTSAWPDPDATEDIFTPKDGIKPMWEKVYDGIVDRYGHRPEAGAMVTFDDLSEWLGEPFPCSGGTGYGPMLKVRDVFLETGVLWDVEYGQRVYRVLRHEEYLEWAVKQIRSALRKLSMAAMAARAARNLSVQQAEARDDLLALTADRLRVLRADLHRVQRRIRLFGSDD